MSGYRTYRISEPQLSRVLLRYDTPPSARYMDNVTLTIELSPDSHLREEAIRSAIVRITGEVESLRSSIVIDPHSREIVQRLYACSMEPNIQVAGLATSDNATSRSPGVQELPAWRICIDRDGFIQKILLYLHHSQCDGWSEVLLLDRIEHVIHDDCTAQSYPGSVDLAYAEAVDRTMGRSLDRSRRYLERILDEYGSSLFPLRRPSWATSSDGARYVEVVSRSPASRLLRSAARVAQTSEASLMASLFAYLVGLLSGMDHATFHTIAGNRWIAGANKSVSCLVQRVPVAIPVVKRQSLRRLVHDGLEPWLGAMQNSHYRELDYRSARRRYVGSLADRSWVNFNYHPRTLLWQRRRDAAQTYERSSTRTWIEDVSQSWASEFQVFMRTINTGVVLEHRAVIDTAVVPVGHMRKLLERIPRWLGQIIGDVDRSPVEDEEFVLADWARGAPAVSRLCKTDTSTRQAIGSLNDFLSAPRDGTFLRKVPFFLEQYLTAGGKAFVSADDIFVSSCSDDLLRGLNYGGRRPLR